MTKIYIQNKPLFLADKVTNVIDDYLHRPETIFIDELNTSAIRTMLYELEQPEFYAGVFLHHNAEELLNAFRAYLTLVVAAGGLVHTQDNELLLIFRRGKWDLPKGKVDEGEDLEACALREIEEETGVNNLKIDSPLHVTYHTYYEKEKHILKESHWYLITAPAKSEATPQTEEDIEQCIWIPADNISPYLDHTHASVAEVIQKGVNFLKRK